MIVKGNRYFVKQVGFKIYVLDWRQLKNKNIFAILISSTAEKTLISDLLKHQTKH